MINFIKRIFTRDQDDKIKLGDRVRVKATNEIGICFVDKSNGSTTYLVELPYDREEQCITSGNLSIVSDGKIYESGVIKNIATEGLKKVTGVIFGNKIFQSYKPCEIELYTLEIERDEKINNILNEY